MESGESTSMTPASDPPMAAATSLGLSKVLGPAEKHKDITLEMKDHCLLFRYCFDFHSNVKTCTYCVLKMQPLCTLASWC